MTQPNDEDAVDVIEPLDDLRDDDLWAQYEDGEASVILNIARKQAQATLGLINSKRADIKMLRQSGQIPFKPATSAIYELNKKYRSTLVFLQLVEARQVKLNHRKAETLTWAIERHRRVSEASDYEPTEFDHALWATIDERN